MELLEFVACASAATGRGAVAFHVRVGDRRESVNERVNGHELAAGVGEACWRVGGRVGAAVQAVVVARGGEEVEIVAGCVLFGWLEDRLLGLLRLRL